MADQIQADMYLYPHFRNYLREVRVVAYSQFLESYKSVTMKSMAAAFNVGVEFLDKEISEFIVAGRLHAKIDKVAGVVETNRYARCAKNHELLCGFVFLAAGCFRSRHSIRHAYICTFFACFLCGPVVTFVYSLSCLSIGHSQWW